MTLFSRPKPRRARARRPARRPGCPLRLEALEARLLLTCLGGPPDDWYVWDMGQQGPGQGTEADPWKTVAVLNSQIAAYNVCPGDTVHFRRGATYQKANIVFDQRGGTASEPITIEGLTWGASPARPKLDAGNGSGITVTNAAGFIIKGLEIFGNYDPSAAQQTNIGNGIEFIATAGSGTFERIEISDVDIHHFNGCPCGYPGGPSGSGILIFAQQPEAPTQEYVHFRDIKIYDDLLTENEPTEVHHNRFAGIYLTDERLTASGFHLYAHEKVHIHHVKAHNQIPYRDKPGDLFGGWGIILGNVSDAVVERNQVYDNGRSDEPVSNAALGVANSEHVLLQYNEVRNTMSRGVEGIGIDFDQWTLNSIMQFNYTHSNRGPGIMLGGAAEDELMSTRNVVRYNVSQSDSRGSNRGSILVENWTHSDVDVYGNTVYATPNGLHEKEPAALNFYADDNCPNPCSPTIRVYNNIFYTTDPLQPAVEVEAPYLAHLPTLVLKANDYVNTALPSGTFLIKWGATHYATLEGQDGFRAGTGQEIHGNMDVGTSTNPNIDLIGMAGNIVNIDEMQLELMPYYQLQPDTPQEVKTGGLNLFDLGLLWDPDGHWGMQPHWEGIWDPDPRDLFTALLPGAGIRWSIGASQ